MRLFRNLFSKFSGSHASKDGPRVSAQTQNGSPNGSVQSESDSTESLLLCSLPHLGDKSLAAIVLMCSFLGGIGCLNTGLLADDYTNLQLLTCEPLACLKQGFAGVHMGMPAFGLHFRPLLTFAYLFDVFLCGTDTFKLHLSNLTLHSFTSLLCFVLTRRLAAHLSFPRPLILAFWASLLFAWHPYHAECLNWWIAKVDMVYSFWYLLSIWFFLRATETRTGEFPSGNSQSGYLRFSGRRANLFASLLGFLISLMCKETTIGLPFVLYALSFIRAYEASESFAKRALRAFIQTRYFFLALLIFWLWRYIALGTLMGGYPGLINEGSFWILCQRLFSPGLPYSLFLAAFSGSELYDRTIAAFQALLIAIALIKLSSSKSNFQLPFAIMCFCLVLLVLSVLPGLFIWDPKEPYSASRLLYLPVLPVCFLTAALILSGFRSAALASTMLAAIASIFLFSSSKLCSAWAETTVIFDEFLARLESGMHELKQEEKLVLYDPPLKHEVVLCSVCGMFLRSAMASPFRRGLEPSALVCVQPDFFGNLGSINFSMLRFLAGNDRNRVLISGGKNFRFVSSEERNKLTQKQQEIKAISLDVFKFDDKQAASNCYKLLAPPQSVTTLEYQFLLLELQNKGSKRKQQANISWTSDSLAQGLGSYLHQFELNEKSSESEKLYIHLAERVDWLNSGNASNIAISLADPLILQSASLLSDRELVPSLTPASPAYLNNDALLEPINGKILAEFNIASIAGASSLMLELSAPGTSGFAEFRCNKPVSSSLKLILKNQKKGLVDLVAYMDKSARRQVRAFALSEQGKVLGFCSDPLYLNLAGAAQQSQLEKVSADEH